MQSEIQTSSGIETQPNGTVDGGEPVRWLLVAGAPRSGTTFLGRLIASHPRIALFSEGDLETIVARLRELLSVRIGAEDPATAAEGALDHLAKSFYEARFGKRCLRYIGDKHPVPPEHAVFYEGLIGRPLVQIYIVRAPSAVIASSMTRSADPHDQWHIATIEEAIVEWVRHYESAAARAADANVLVVPYDGFLTEPERVIGAIGGFLGVEPGLFASDFERTVQPPAPSAAARMLVAAVLGDIERALLADFERCLRETPTVYLPLPSGATYPVTDANTLMALVLKTGWGGLEPHGAWTVDDQAVLAFRVAHEPGSVVAASLFVVGFSGDRPGCTISVAGTVAGATTHELPAGGAVHELAVETRVDAEHVVRLVLRVQRPKDPAEAPIHDPRRLGVLLQALRISAEVTPC